MPKLLVEILEILLDVRFQCRLTVEALFDRKSVEIAKNVKIKNGIAEKVPDSWIDLDEINSSSTDLQSFRQFKLQICLSSSNGKLCIFDRVLDLKQVNGSKKYFQMPLEKCPDKNSKIKFNLGIDSNSSQTQLSSNKFKDQYCLQQRQKLQERQKQKMNLLPNNKQQAPIDKSQIKRMIEQSKQKRESSRQSNYRQGLSPLHIGKARNLPPRSSEFERRLQKSNQEGIISPRYESRLLRTNQLLENSSQKTNKKGMGDRLVRVSEHQFSKKDSQLEVQVTSLNNELAIKQGRLNQLQRSRSSLLERFEKIENELKNSNAANLRLSSERVQLESRLTQQIERNECQKIEIQSLVSRQQTKTNQYKEQLKIQAKKLSERDVREQQLCFEIEQLKIQREDQQKNARIDCQQIQNRHSEQISKIKKQLLRVENEKAKKDIQIQQLTVRLESINAKMQSAMKGAQSNRNEKHSLIDTITTMKVELLSKQQQIEHLKNFNLGSEEIQKENENLKEERNKYIERCNSCEVKVESLNKKIGYLEKKRQSSVEEFSHLEAKCLELQQSEKRLKKKAQSLEEELKVKSSDCENSHFENQQLCQKIRQLQRQTEQSSVEFSTKIHLRNQELERVNRQLQRKESELAQLKNEIIFHSETAKQLNERIKLQEDVVSSINTLASQFFNSVIELDVLKILSKCPEIKSSLRCSVNSSGNDVLKTIQSNNFQTLYLCKALSTQCLRLSKENSELSHEISKTFQSLKQMQIQSLSQKDKNSELFEKKSTLQQKLSDNQSMLEHLQSGINSKSEEIERLTVKVRKLDNETEKLHEQILTKNHKISDLQYQIKELKSQLFEVDQGINMLSTKFQTEKLQKSFLREFDEKLLAEASSPESNLERQNKQSGREGLEAATNIMLHVPSISKADRSLGQLVDEFGKESIETVPQNSENKDKKIREMVKGISVFRNRIQKLEKVNKLERAEKQNMYERLTQKQEELDSLALKKRKTDKDLMEVQDELNLTRERLKQEEYQRNELLILTKDQKTRIAKCDEESLQLKGKYRQIFQEAVKKWKVIIPWVLQILAQNENLEVYSKLAQTQAESETSSKSHEVSEAVLLGQLSSEEDHEQNLITISSAFEEIQFVLKRLERVLKQGANYGQTVISAKNTLELSLNSLQKQLKEAQVLSRQRSDEIIELNEKLSQAKRAEQNVKFQKEKLQKKLELLEKAIEASDGHINKMKNEVKEMEEKVKLTEKSTKFVENSLNKSLKELESEYSTYRSNTSQQLLQKKIEVDELKANMSKMAKAHETMKKENTELLQSNASTKAYMQKVTILVADIFKSINNIERENKLSSFYLIPLRDTVRKVETALTIKALRKNSAEKKTSSRNTESTDGLKGSLSIPRMNRSKMSEVVTSEVGGSSNKSQKKEKQAQSRSNEDYQF